MKVIYDKEQKMYVVELEPLEMTTIINTDDIVDAREIFVDCMKHLFNEAINKQLK